VADVAGIKDMDGSFTVRVAQQSFHLTYFPVADSSSWDKQQVLHIDRSFWRRHLLGNRENHTSEVVRGSVPQRNR
jgi:hypothetical protein